MHPAARHQTRHPKFCDSAPLPTLTLHVDDGLVIRSSHADVIGHLAAVAAHVTAGRVLDEQRGLIQRAAAELVLIGQVHLAAVLVPGGRYENTSPNSPRGERHQE